MGAMADTSPGGVDFADFGRVVYPRLVGSLVLCGMEPAAATAHVEAIVQREVRAGLAGGTDATRLVVQRVLETAVPPPVSRGPADDVERALAPLPWGVRLSTVGTIALGDLTATVRTLDPPATLVGVDDTQVRAAVEARAPAPDPDLRQRLRRRSLRRVLKVAVPIAIIVLAVLIVASILAARSAGRSPSAGTITEWVAVLDVGPDARSLYGRAADVGKVAGVYVFVDRWACYDGFPAGTPHEGGDWFLGVGAAERSVVDDIVARLGQAPLVFAEVRQGCPLPTDVPSTDART
jgi:hypothetical protein